MSGTDFYSSIDVSASGLSAERLEMDVIANNIANANTTRTPQGGAFKRELVVFAQKPDDASSTAQTSDGFGAFGEPGSTTADGVAQSGASGVEVAGIEQDPSPDRLVFDPSNPDADARGYVHYPNVDITKEIVDMMSASRAYQANVSAIEETRTMSDATLNILKS